MDGERIERFFDDWDGWSLLLMLAGSVLCLVMLIPALNIGLGDEQARFIVLILALTAISAACIQLAMPRSNYDNDYVAFGLTGSGPIAEDVQDIEVQKDLYEELRAAFVRRVRVHRGVDETMWSDLDAVDLERLIGDRLLVDLARGFAVNEGRSIFGNDFPFFFDGLLRKVEEWR